MLQPITPKEAAEQLPKHSAIPELLFRVVNDLILQKFDGTNKFDITIPEIKSLWKSFTVDYFQSSYLNFEPFYEKAGWNVEWIKESNAWEDGYDRFEFSPKSNKG